MTRKLEVRSIRFDAEPDERGDLRGEATFSDGRTYAFGGSTERGFEFVTAPAFGTNRTRWFESPARSAALLHWLRWLRVRTFI